MQLSLLASVLSSLLLLAPVLQAKGDPKPLAPANPAIEISSMRAHMAYLASDELRGREAFTEDSLQAAKYLRACLKQAGVAPGWKGEYFQPAPFERITEEAAPELTLVDAKGVEHTLEFGRQFRASGRRGLNSTEDLQVLHVKPDGELSADGLKGRAVLFQGSSREWRSWWAKHKDTGVALVLRYSSGKKERKSLSASRPSVKPAWGDSAGKASTPIVTLYGDMDAWIGGARGARITAHQTIEAIVENNVVGVLPGAGTPDNPDLAKEIIVVSAHYDHVGMKKDDGNGGDLIHNGADDDASGVVVLLDLAEALVAGERPARTIVFLLAAAEEKGVLGTKYFADNPSFPMEQIVCNLNLEMLGRPDDLVGGPGKLWLTGFERSNLGTMFQEAGIPVVEDKRPEMNFFGRSDNIVFVRKGVVGQTLSSFNIHKDYHRVSDEIGTIDFEHMKGAAEGALAATLLLANAKEGPHWLEGEPKGYK
ncbi:MAG: M20/M25/M40 family metallo-hydrolase [bacterium]|nr:M20/M25/M40 family metallo-hydrolase [bacterium]